MKNKLLILSMLLTVFASANAQSLIGFWTVEHVQVGDENLTPVAKWFKYDEDNTYTAGNGWTQNDKGTWNYSEELDEFLPVSRLGADEYGAFKVQFIGEKMTWKRSEDGMNVSVTLSRIAEMPMAPKDSIVGNWELTSVIQNNEDVTSEYNKENTISIFIRWTATYRKTDTNGSRSSGYWHMNPHRSEFHLINYNKELGVEEFLVSFKNDLLFMKPKNKEGTIFTYQRR
ncbi:MAG: hypothetical protein ABJG47_01120 [Ekhidna sp.]